MKSLIDKIRSFNWSHFSEIGREAQSAFGSAMQILNDARKLGKSSSAADIAAIIERLRAFKDGTSLDEMLSKILNQGDQVFDGHAEERAELLRLGQKLSPADLDRRMDRPEPQKPTEFPFGEARSGSHPLAWNEAKLLVPGTYRIYRHTGGARWVVDRIDEPLRDSAEWRVDPVQS